MKKEYRTIAGRTFRKLSVGGYAYNISKRHIVYIMPCERGWKASEVRIPSKGSYVEGTKEVKTLCTVKASTLNLVATQIFAMVED